METTNSFTLPGEAIASAAVWTKGNGCAPVASETADRNVRATPPESAPLHRLSEVREQEGVSRHTVASRLGISEAEVTKREQPSSDMLLSELRRWRQALQVPMADLLEEPDEALSAAVQLRAQLVRAMKTVRSIEERTRQGSVHRLAGMLVEQLVEMMPELKTMGAWPAVGQRRSRREPGQAYFRGQSFKALDQIDAEQ